MQEAAGIGTSCCAEIKQKSVYIITLKRLPTPTQLAKCYQSTRGIGETYKP